MKILNRPMFRYGGPIKEGIMSGIKEPRQRYQDAGSVFKNVQSVLEDGAAADSAVLNEAAKLGIGNPYRQEEFRPYMKKTITKPTNLSEIDLATAGGYGEIEKPFIDYEKIPKYIEDVDGDGIRDLNPEYTKNKTFLNDIFGGPYEQKQKPEFRSTIETGKASGVDMPPMLDKSGNMGSGTIEEVIENKGKIEKIPELNKKERVDSILESLGYDRAQKNALYDAMIKAGQRISRTGLSADNLVSDVIAETSQSYDKPEKLREAANLMDVQQKLKIDQIEASKTGGAMAQNYQYFIDRGYSPEAAQRKSEGLATNLLEAKNKAIDAKLTGNKLTEYVAQQLIGIKDAYDNNTYRGTINSKDHKSVSDFVKSTDFDGAGVYTVKGRIIELDKNGKILKEEIVTSSTSDKKWWNFGKEE